MITEQNPFAAFGGISQLTGGEGGIFGTTKEREEEPEKDEESSYLDTFDVDYDDDRGRL